jgi:hypothetical protein
MEGIREDQRRERNQVKKMKTKRRQEKILSRKRKKREKKPKNQEKKNKYWEKQKRKENRKNGVRNNKEERNQTSWRGNVFLSFLWMSQTIQRWDFVSLTGGKGETENEC